MIEDEEQPINLPHTDSEAKPINWDLAPSGRTVIEVKDAHYRKAVISGLFLVALNNKHETRNKDGHKTVEVECSWYGWQPQKRSLRLTLINAEEVVADYENIEVVKNIGRKF